MEPVHIFLVNFFYLVFIGVWWMSNEVPRAIREINDILDEV